LLSAEWIQFSNLVAANIWETFAEHTIYSCQAQVEILLTPRSCKLCSEKYSLIWTTADPCPDINVKSSLWWSCFKC